MQLNWKQYRFELIALALALLGLFLLIEPYQIRETFWYWSARILRAGARIALGTADSIVDFVSRQTLSDLTGMILVLMAAVLILVRLRWHLLHNEKWTRRVCPQCGSALVRIHRTPWDRITNKLMALPLARYLCTACRWSGRRYGHAHLHTEDLVVSSDVEWDDRYPEQDEETSSEVR